MPPDDHAGDAWIVLSWASVALFLVVAVPAAAGVSAFDDLAVGVPLALFLLGVVLMLWSYVAGLARTTRGDNIVVTNLYFLAGSAPRRVQLHLFGALGASIAAAAVIAAWNPAGVLVPILPLGINGMWAVRHGTFPPRPVRDDTARGRARSPGSASSAPSSIGPGAQGAPGRRRGGRPGQ